MIVITKKPVEVTDKFQFAMRDFILKRKQSYESHLETLNSYVASGNSWYSHDIAETKDALRTLREEYKKLADWDNYRTHLQALRGYTKFQTASHNGITYLVGLTTSVSIEHQDTTYNFGPFSICIPYNAFDDCNARAIHFIPVINPKGEYRHPHHYVRFYKSPIDSPFDGEVNTCLGEFNYVVASLLTSMDFVGLFAILYTFITRYNDRSPLIGIRNITWAAQ